jgi:hypothetical protein
LLDENVGRFAAKWGLNGTHGRRVALTPCTVNPPEKQEESRPQISQINADSDLRFQISNNVVNQSKPVIDRISTLGSVPPASSPSLNLRESEKSADKHDSVRITDAAAGDITLKVGLIIIIRNEERNLSNVSRWRTRLKGSPHAIATAPVSAATYIFSLPMNVRSVILFYQCRRLAHFVEFRGRRHHGRRLKSLREQGRCRARSLVRHH